LAGPGRSSTEGGKWEFVEGESQEIPKIWGEVGRGGSRRIIKVILRRRKGRRKLRGAEGPRWSFPGNWEKRLPKRTDDGAMKGRLRSRRTQRSNNKR